MELWQARRRIEFQYRRSVYGLLKACLSAYEHSNSSVDDFVWMMRQYASSDAFQQYALTMARSMVTGLFDDVGKSWREAARHNTNSREIYNLLMEDIKGARGDRLWALINENAQLIRTLPVSTAEQVTEYVGREALKGRRHEDIAHDIMSMFPRRTKARAKLIARTEVAKAQTALIQSDCEIVGADWYIWHSTHDQRVRDSHARMDGIICSWRDPPNPEKLFPRPGVRPYGSYPPGGTFNCRCYPEPLVTMGQLTGSTYKVHLYGKIVNLNRSKVANLLMAP